MKPHDLFIVRASGNGWAVHLNEQTFGTFERRPDAVQAAVAVAESSGRFGRTSAVVSEGNAPDLGARARRLFKVYSIPCPSGLNLTAACVLGWRNPDPNVTRKPKEHIDRGAERLAVSAHPSAF
jgi:hypothetical protein